MATPKPEEREVLLAAALVAAPGALVGEIGLDKAARTPDTGRVEYEKQQRVFRQQLLLARRREGLIRNPRGAWGSTPAAEPYGSARSAQGHPTTPRCPHTPQQQLHTLRHIA